MKTNIFKSRRFKHGTLATVITVVFIAAVVLVNIIATILLDKFPLNIDLTKEQSMSMAEDSKDFLKKLDKEVKIHVLAEESIFNQAGNFYYTHALNTMKQCTQYSGKVSLDFINLEKNPTYGTGKYSESLQAGNIIIESDLRYKIVSIEDLFEVTYAETDYYQQNPQISSSKAEQVMLSGIMFVSETNPTEVTLLTGFSEVQGGYSGIQSLLESNNYSFKTVNILTEDIPDSSNMVIIPAPTKDYTQKEIDKLETFLGNNGKNGKKLIYLASYQQGNLPILEGYLETDWGIKIGSGVIWETNASNVYGYSYYNTLNTLTGNGYTDGLADSTLPVYMSASRPVTAAFETKSEMKTTSLITSADTCVLQPMDAGEDWTPDNETKQAFTTAVSCTRTKYDSDTNEALESTVVAFGSLDFFVSGALQMDTFNNGDFTVNMCNDLVGKEDNTLNIVPKSDSSETLDITEATVKVFQIIFVIVVPIAVLATGLIIWFRRRHR